MSLNLSPLRIRAADCPSQPWKNGGGVTRELLTYPSKEDWQLRISVADITQNGAFSRFDGVSRAFAVIEGAGVRLQFLDHLCTVTQDSEPLMFDGGDAPNCMLIDGATRDLNVMCKTGRQANLGKAYGCEERACRGLFLIEDQSLQWHEQTTKMQAPKSPNENQYVGWWIDFL